MKLLISIFCVLMILPRPVKSQQPVLSTGSARFVFSEDGLQSAAWNFTGKQLEFNGLAFRIFLGDGRILVPEKGQYISRQQTDGVLRMVCDDELTGLRLEVLYKALPGKDYLRKKILIKNEGVQAVVVRDIEVVNVQVPSMPGDQKLANPVIYSGGFIGLEWPIAQPEIHGDRLIFKHYPAKKLKPQETMSSKWAGFGVSEEGSGVDAFGSYLLDIRANRVPFKTLYFDWLTHDNSGPLEEEILASVRALKVLRERYGLQFDLYNADAGLVESAGTYFDDYKETFRKRYPEGLQRISEAMQQEQMKLALWIGPDGFGETPESMNARKDQLIKWVRDDHVGLFKMDAVVSAIRDRDPYILEKKWNHLVDAIREIRQIDPEFVVINHRINHNPYILTITDCMLWNGQETYIDVHIHNHNAMLYNRDAAKNRDLVTSYYGQQFRLFEDHGVCFNTSIENWADEMVAQAFGRASVISPELYGGYFFLPDKDYATLANLIRLHKMNEPVLEHAFVLSKEDIARSDGQTSFLILRNMSWDPGIKTIPLDTTIGLQTERTILWVLRQHPYHELLIKPEGGFYQTGDTLHIRMDPFQVKLVEVSLKKPEGLLFSGVSYDYSRTLDRVTAYRLIGLPGEQDRVHLYRDEDTHSDSLFIQNWEGQPITHPWFEYAGGFEPADWSAERIRSTGEAIKFQLPDEGLEIRELHRQSDQPVAIHEIQTCRDLMMKRLIKLECDGNNLFDRNDATRYSDGYGFRMPYSGYPAPYRSDSSVWRFDLGRVIRADAIEFDVVRLTGQTIQGDLEVSKDREHWAALEVNLPDTVQIPYYKTIRVRRKKIRLYDVMASDSVPVRIRIRAGMKFRYLKYHGRNLSLSGVTFRDRRNHLIEVHPIRINNFYGPADSDYRVMVKKIRLDETWPGQELAVTVESDGKPLGTIDQVMAGLLVNGQVVAAPHRAPAYPYHPYEANASYLNNRGISGMTFRIPVKAEWKG
ncbi:MAG: hypothetical protein J7L89_03815, partial [Bacteroidales bacterium]|nr:hypothetical protein [Bacteroidales bacterium]